MDTIDIDSEMAFSNLEHVRVVMVHTSHPGNIGAAARAMKTMGFRHLVLVQPRDFPSDTATA
ncbi:MAG: tRNA (cytidine32/uridine32-2'-O)-methyltransferase, partial [Reinekea sp.]